MCSSVQVFKCSCVRCSMFLVPRFTFLKETRMYGVAFLKRLRNDSYRNLVPHPSPLAWASSATSLHRSIVSPSPHLLVSPSFSRPSTFHLLPTFSRSNPSYLRRVRLDPGNCQAGFFFHDFQKFFSCLQIVGLGSGAFHFPVFEIFAADIFHFG
jgi:hypothetical protein